MDALRALLRGEHGGIGRGLNFCDDALDITGGVRTLDGELADFLGDHREPFAVFARPGGLDGRVERKQVGLLGDVADGLDDDADLLGLAGKLENLPGDPAHALLDDFHALDRQSDELPAILGRLHRVLGGAENELDHLGGLSGGDGNLVDGRGGLVNHPGFSAKVRLPADERGGERPRIIEDSGGAVLQPCKQETVARDDGRDALGQFVQRALGGEGRRDLLWRAVVPFEELPQPEELFPGHGREGQGAATLVLLPRLDGLQSFHDPAKNSHRAGGGGILGRGEPAVRPAVGDVRERGLQALEESRDAHLLPAAPRIGRAHGRGRRTDRRAQPGGILAVCGGGGRANEIPGDERSNPGTSAHRRPAGDRDRDADDDRRRDPDEEQDPAILSRTFADAPETRGLLAGELIVNSLVEDVPAFLEGLAQLGRPGRRR